MRTSEKTIVRREHWRWQRCGPGRSELRRVHVRQARVTLGPTDARQLDLLERTSERGGGSGRPRSRREAGDAPAAPRVVMRSYWRRQPYGPGSSLRKTILVDVRA